MAVQSGIYKGVSAADRAAERRARLLAAGLTVWADPATRTTMTAVCAEAGLTERYFYESFSGLDALLEAVMDEIAAEIEQRSRAAAESAGDDPADRVHASVRAFMELLLDDPRKGRVAIVESVAVPALRRRRTELLRHLAHQSAIESRKLLGSPGRGARGLAGAGSSGVGSSGVGSSGRSANEDEIGGLLFIGGMAELITAWLDGTLAASTEEIVEAASRALLGIYR